MFNLEVCVIFIRFYSNDVKILLSKFLVYVNREFIEWNVDFYWNIKCIVWFSGVRV